MIPVKTLPMVLVFYGFNQLTSQFFFINFSGPGKAQSQRKFITCVRSFVRLVGLSVRVIDSKSLTVKAMYFICSYFITGSAIDLDSSIRLEVINGRAVKISGGRAAQALDRLVDSIGPNARMIGEFGLGTNPAARLSPEVLEAEKVFGTCHLALGNNSGFGGIISVPFHSDGIILQPTVAIDGRVIVRDNKVLL